MSIDIIKCRVKLPVVILIGLVLIVMYMALWKTDGSDDFTFIPPNAIEVCKMDYDYLHLNMPNMCIGDGVVLEVAQKRVPTSKLKKVRHSYVTKRGRLGATKRVLKGRVGSGGAEYGGRSKRRQKSNRGDGGGLKSRVLSDPILSRRMDEHGVVKIIPNKIHVTVTAFNPTLSQCDSTPNITASGSRVRAGMIAISRDVEKRTGAKFGDRIKVYFPDGTVKHYIFHDRMALKKRRAADVLMFSPKSAKVFGRKRAYLVVQK